MVIVAVKVSCHNGVVTMFDVKYMTLESMILFFVCPTYLIWHQLHSKQYIKLLLWQVPLVIVCLHISLQIGHK